MTHLRRIMSAAALTTTTILSIGSANAGAYTAIYAFGDSLSDAGNVYLATGGVEPGAPYYQGHFSNGPTWVENLAVSLGLGTLKPSLSGGNDFAYGGAVTGSSVPGATTAVPNITQQVAQFVVATGGVGNASPTALYTVWIGANDIFQAITDIAGAIISPTTAATDLAAAAQVAANAVDSLAKDGGKNFLVPLIPALGLTPSVSATPLASLATALAAQYNADLLGDLTTVVANDKVTVNTIDTFSLIENSVSDPSAYGYTNVTASCYVGPYTGGGTVCANPNQYLFWDGVHPTETGQEVIANAALTAVPEPTTLAILAGAVTALSLFYRRKTQVASFRLRAS